MWPIILQAATHQPGKANVLALWGKKIHQPRGETGGGGWRSHGRVSEILQNRNDVSALARSYALLHATRVSDGQKTL